MAQSDIARFPSGVNNMPENSGLADLRWPNPLLYNLQYDDFNNYRVLEWTSNGGGAVGLVAGTDGGVVSLSTSAVANNEMSIAYGAPNLTFVPNVSKDLIFAARIQLDDVLNGGFLFGLSVAAVDPLTTPPSDGMYFRKLTGQTAGQFTIRVGGTNVFDVAFPTMASGVWYDIVAAYSSDDGVFRAFVNDGAVRVATNPTQAQLGTVPMGVVFSARNQTAAVRTLFIDNYLVAKAR